MTNTNPDTILVNKLVLIVEDDPDSLKVIDRLLKSWKMQTILAFTGEEALKILGDTIPDLAIIDLSLAADGIDGMSLLRTMRANQSTARIPAFTVTAWYSDHVENEAKRIGFTTCLSKPFKQSDIKQASIEALSTPLPSH